MSLTLAGRGTVVSLSTWEKRAGVHLQNGNAWQYRERMNTITSTRQQSGNFASTSTRLAGHIRYFLVHQLGIVRHGALDRVRNIFYFVRTT